MDRGTPDDPNDRSLVLDGRGWVEFPEVDDRFDLLPGEERTFSFWIRYERPQYHAKILDKLLAPGGGAMGYAIFVHQYSTTLAIWHQGISPVDETGFTRAGMSGNRRIGDGEWHHVAVVQRDTILEGWVDGLLEFREDISVNLHELDNETPLRLGWNMRDVVLFQGEVDELSIWSRALDTGELRRLMYSRPEGTEPHLTAWWPMDGEEGQVVTDRGPSGLHGRGTGVTRTAATRPIRPPLQDRRAFPLVVALAAALMLWAVLWIYGRRLNLQKARLEQQVRDRVRDLARTNAEKDEALAVIASQTERLRTLDDARRRFFVNVSHEFRTPLSLIIGPLSDLLSGTRRALHPEDRGAVEVALRSSRRLLHLTEQLLDLARIESGALRLERQPVDLVAMLRDAAHAFDAGARSDGIRVSADLPAGPVLVTGDPQRLETLFSNLLSNALRFSPEGSEVRIALSETEAWIEVRVEDDGPGVPADQADRIFERFYQTEQGRAAGGTGVGLALVRELAELHEGEVELVDLEQPGATFRVRFPPRCDESASEGTEKGTPTRDFDVAAGAREDGRQGRPPTPRQACDADSDDSEMPMALVVEDDPDLRRYLAELLSADWRVVEAADGAEAIQLAGENPPDLIVSDVMMPRRDGLELLEDIRRDPDLETIPVLLLTARSELEDRLAGFERDADAYLAKPFESTELIARVESLHRQRTRLRDRLRAERDAPVPEGSSGTGDGEGGSEFETELRAAALASLDDPAFGVAELAAAVAMERTGLYRRMEEELGRTPSDFMRELRMSRAAELLDSGHTVAEVACAVGYASVSSFSRRFRDHHGTTPGRWSNRSAAPAPDRAGESIG